jgi:hypothetical protein
LLEQLTLLSDPQDKRRLIAGQQAVDDVFHSQPRLSRPRKGRDHRATSVCEESAHLAQDPALIRGQGAEGADGLDLVRRRAIAFVTEAGERIGDAKCAREAQGTRGAAMPVELGKILLCCLARAGHGTVPQTLVESLQLRFGQPLQQDLPNGRLLMADAVWPLGQKLGPLLAHDDVDQEMLRDGAADDALEAAQSVFSEKLSAERLRQHLSKSSRCALDVVFGDQAGGHGRDSMARGWAPSTDQGRARLYTLAPPAKGATA